MDINQMIQDLDAIGIKAYTDIDLQEDEIKSNKEAVKRQRSEIMDQRAKIKAQHKQIKDSMK